MNTGRRVTLKDVSDLSGYSLRTVKKVLGSGEYVSEDVRSAVAAAAEKLRYKRNRIASALARNRAYKIALVYAEASKYYFPEVEAGFSRCLDEVRDYGFSVEYCKCVTDAYDWQRGVLDALALREDIAGVVLQPMSATGMDASIDRLVALGKPVITFGSDAPESRRLCYIGPRAAQSGRIAAQIMARFIGGRGVVYIINQLSEHMQTAERSAGFRAYIGEHCPKIGVYTVNRPANAQMYFDIVRNMVLNERVDGLFCTDADTYMAGRVLADLGRRDITLIGYDLPEESRNLMREGFISVLLYQNPEAQGYLSLKTMCDFLLDGAPPADSRIHTDVHIYTSECLN